MEWNPLAEAEVVWRDVPSSRGAAKIAGRRWSGRERMAYEDAMTTAGIVVDAPAGDVTVDEDRTTVRMGELRLVAATLTLVDAAGFPEIDGEPFDPSKRDHLLAVTGRVLAEILTIAGEIQPLPGNEDDDEEPDDQADAEAGLDDPSPTPPTPPAEPTASADTAASHDE